MLTPVDQPIDDLADLTPSEWENLRDWEGPSEPERRLVRWYRELTFSGAHRALCDQVHLVRVRPVLPPRTPPGDCLETDSSLPSTRRDLVQGE